MNISDYENYQEIKDHYNSNFSYNTYPCTIPLDFPSVPLHWHNEMELIYVKKGNALITIDMKDYILTPDSIAIILPGHIHGIAAYTEILPENFNTSYSALNLHALEYENIIFDINMLYPKQGDLKTEEFFNQLMHKASSCPCLITPDTFEYSTIISCINRADMICQTFPDCYYLGIKSCLFEFFFTLSKIMAAKSKHLSNNDIFYANTPVEYLDRIKTITKYIEFHYSENITIKKMADICNISQSHFMKFFKSQMGCSFIDYLNDYRLITASRMLTSSNANIIDISTNCGFENVSYFNRLFKKKFQVTPKQYRRMS